MGPKQYLTPAILVRVIADILMVNAGLLFGLLARFVGLALYNREPLPSLGNQALAVWRVYLWSAPLLTAICVIVFAAVGFYTRGRFYTGRYKGIVIVQAVSLGYLLFGFLTYFVPALPPHPRAALAMGWLATAAWLISARLWSTVWRYVVRLEDGGTGRGRGHRPITSVLVLGGAGYIGSVLCRQLLTRGYSVRVLDPLLYGEESIRPLLTNRGFQFVEGDSRNIEAVVRAMQGVDAVIHLGEIVGDPAAKLDEQMTREINVAATRMVAEAAKGYGVERFIYASSCSVYGASEGVLEERSALSPLSLYASCKVDAEDVLLSLDDNNFNPVILRLATVYGLSPRPRFDLVINLLTAKAVIDGEITIFGGQQWRPFVHVADVAACMIEMLERPLASVKRQVFNVGSDVQNYTLDQIGEIIHSVIPDADLVRMDHDQDARNYHVSFRKIQREVGFSPRFSAELGVREIEQALRSGLIKDYRDRRYSNYRTLSEQDHVLELVRRHQINALYRDCEANFNGNFGDESRGAPGARAETPGEALGVPLPEPSRVPTLHRCPVCDSTGIHRSHVRSWTERIKKEWSHLRPYRCHDCAWRGWLAPVAAVQPPSLSDTPDVVDLQSIDAAVRNGARPSRPAFSPRNLG